MSNFERLLKRIEVIALTGLSRSTIDRKVREGTVPRATANLDKAYCLARE